MKPEPVPGAFDSRALKGRSGWRRVVQAGGYSWAGLRAAFSVEAAFRQLLALNALLVPLAFYLTADKLERALLIAVCLLALIVELLNSALEATVDRISLTLHPLSKQAKDMGSAAQLLALTLIAVVWTLLLL
ncbi:diacylglycerol kinase [Pseudomonas sp. UBA2684]|uniref:diacylglycerol kinase n=1 Tax=Pseudomonas sp. UBA2684 TaxID=1947311 RepID=UPI000E96CF46|nr:diacylglycerol kinase [Pseudomonas sp. UBA2684]HBX57502.1 diacylglycerol kinase [Pseudomonas sp.]|tara:strand:- start:487 stop:882 length:396 start_codon:yes stop_codon:yes gene_type:complete